MNWIKKITILVAGLFVLAHLAGSVGYNPISAKTTNTFGTELLLSNEAIANNALQYETAAQLLQFSCAKKKDVVKFDWYGSLQKAVINNVLNFKVQTLIALAFRPLLLTIVLNDILQQKSHWI